MPTEHPRIYLTLSETALKRLDALCEKLGLRRPEVLRKALKELAAKHGIGGDPT